MSSQQSPSNFLDPKTLIALVLLGFAWFGWQSYLQQKYPDAYKPEVNDEAQKTQKQKRAVEGTESDIAQTNSDSGVKQLEVTSSKVDELSVSNMAEPEQTFGYEDEKLEFEISSLGMGFKSYRLKDHTDREGQKYSFVATNENRINSTRLLGKSEPISFQVEKVGRNTFVGVAIVDGMNIKKSIEVNSDSFVIKTKVDVENPADNFLGLETSLALHLEEYEHSTFLPTFERQEAFALGSEGEERILIDSTESLKESFDGIKVASLGTQYFSQSIVDHSKIAPEFKVEANQGSGIAQGILRYSALSKKEFHLEYDAFIGPKYLNIMESVDKNLPAVIDFGFFSWLAKPMLQLLKIFHQFLGNWGFSIILLTIIIRVIVLPFTVMSYKSMNKMKLIQPRIKALKEKYKDDAQKLNQEMMALMKNNKVNPLGGCLPMLLQFPVFIALYQVLGQSVELYQAPFMFWINDLSLKDPYYVLPVLMGITMFVQQKITPNTMDPAQAKVMMFLPLVFVLFMVGLPSGLTLYIFVSSLFAIIQQMIFMRDTLVEKEIQTA